VHFATSKSVKSVLDASGCGELMLLGKQLVVSSGPKNPLRMNQRRKDIIPYKMTDVFLDVGTLVSPDELLVSWRGPDRGVTFSVDPFDLTCKFCFKRKTVFAFKDQGIKTVVECDYKVEFPVRDINGIKRYRESSALVILLELASSPLVYYRSADDDIYNSVPYDLLDDDDPWIRTSDFTGSGTIGRCSSYRIVIPPRNGPKLERAIKYLIEHRVPVESGVQLRVKDEPKFGMKGHEHDLAVTEVCPHPKHRKQMKSHQIEGFNFLLSNLVSENPGGCILAHAPGCRKTFMIISFMQSFLARYPDATPLVVLPKGISL